MRSVSKSSPSDSLQIRLSKMQKKMDHDGLGEVGLIPIHKIPDGKGPGMVVEIKTLEFSAIRAVIKEFARGAYRVHGILSAGAPDDIGWWLPDRRILVLRSSGLSNQGELFALLSFLWCKDATLVVGSHWLVGRTKPQVAAIQMLNQAFLFKRKLGVAFVGRTEQAFARYHKKVVDDLHKQGVSCLLYTESTQQLVSLIGA